MTREEFKKLWEADEKGSGITFDDIADRAKEWGLFEGEHTGVMLILEPSFPSKDVSPQTSNWQLSQCKPYLRPVSSMTEEEKFELKQEHVKDQQLFAEVIVVLNNTEMRGKVIPHFAADWCDKNMFDFRGLIDKDLALSTETFNPYKD